MKRLLLVATATLLTILTACGVAVGSIQQGFIAPPQGAIDIGPVRIIGVQPCPQAWPPLGWNRACDDDRPWALQAVVHWPGGEVWQQEVIRLRIRHISTVPKSEDALLSEPFILATHLHM
jgi:hypothetical protein